MNTTIIFRNGRVIDPSNNIDAEKMDIWVRDGVLAPAETEYPICVILNLS